MDITNVANLTNPELTHLETKNIALVGADLERCARTIEEALRGKPGIKEVRVDQENGMAIVTVDVRQTNFPEVHDLLLKGGYRPARVVAD